MVGASENYKVKEIDKRILTELRKNLEIKRENVDIIDKTHIDIIFKKISEKKEIIFSLFNGDFSENEYNLKRRMHMSKSKELSMHDSVANNVISRRLEVIFDRMISLEQQNKRVVSVCTDRLFFLQSILKENVSIDFVQEYISSLKIEI